MNIKQKRDAVNVFDRYLSQDESILWVGQPNPRWLLSKTDLFMIPFSLMWGGFALTWESGVLNSRAPISFVLWGIPFVVIGQYMIWGRFIHKYLRRRRTYYAITDQRALVLETFWGTHLKTYFLRQLVSLDRQGKSVLLGVNDATLKPKHTQPDLFGEAQPGFYAVPDADEVYNLLQHLLVSPKPKNS